MFVPDGDLNVIYEEGEEVQEMYFIVEGSVKIGYSLYRQKLHAKRVKFAFVLTKNQYFGEYYVLFNAKANFVYVADTQVECFALQKKFLVRKVFGNYPS